MNNPWGPSWSGCPLHHPPAYPNGSGGRWSSSVLGCSLLASPHMSVKERSIILHLFLAILNGTDSTKNHSPHIIKTLSHKQIVLSSICNMIAPCVLFTEMERSNMQFNGFSMTEKCPQNWQGIQYWKSVCETSSFGCFMSNLNIWCFVYRINVPYSCQGMEVLKPMVSKLRSYSVINAL